MGFSFNFFGKREIRKFNYRPRFYDPDEEARREMFGDHSKDKKEKKEYVPGSYVKGSLRDGNYKETKDVTRNQKYLGVLTLILMFAVVFALFKYFPKLLDALSQQNEAQTTEMAAPEAQPVTDDFEIVNLN